MKKIHKIIVIIASIVVLTSVSTAVVRAGTLGGIKNKIGAFIFGANGKNEEQKQCLKNALVTYRESLKGGRDAFVQASNNYRIGYRQAVFAAANDLRNSVSGDKFVRTEKKNDLKITRKSALKDWSDKLQVSRVDWQAAQKAAIENYRIAKEKCLAD